MIQYLFVSTLDNVITKVRADGLDAAWKKYIRHYFQHRLNWGETFGSVREELEHDIFVADEETVREI